MLSQCKSITIVPNKIQLTNKNKPAEADEDDPGVDIDGVPLGKFVSRIYFINFNDFASLSCERAIQFGEGGDESTQSNWNDQVE
jgi:hypothetical protein